jgi:putative mycofactocin binding protein MftB
MRAREESFGLLFYNTGNARLTFVRSQRLLLLTADPINGFIVSSRARSEAEEARAGRILKALRQKRLIVPRSYTGAR